jgi:spermidine synthase
VTAGSFVPYPFIEKITICDIEPLVPQKVTPMFGDVNYHVVDGIAEQNPHTVNGKTVAVAYDDGRHYVRTLPKDTKYDIITSDPIDPWVKGCAALNTVEYYQMCKEHLKPGGVMTLWMPLYESDEATIKSLISTFFKVFPNGVFFSNDLGGQGYDAVLLGYADPVRIDLDKVQETLNRSEYAPVKESLLEVGFGADTEALRLETNVWEDPTIALMATYAGRAEDLGEWMKDAQINTDRNMRLQYLAGMAVNDQSRTAILKGILKYYKFPEAVFTGSSRNLETMKTALQVIGREE